MRFLTWCNKIDERSELLFASARHFGIDVEPIGLGKEYRGGVSKIEWLWEWLQGKKFNTFVVCTDAFDCVYLDKPVAVDSWLKGRGCGVAYAGEKWYRKRPSGYQELFDDLGQSLYKYPNCGCVMGYASDIRKLLEVALGFVEIDKCNLSEQWHMTKAIGRANSNDVVIDYNCNLFWCCAGQWRAAHKLAHIENGRLTNLKTGGQPFVLHSPIPNRSRAFLTETARRLGVPV